MAVAFQPLAQEILLPPPRLRQQAVRDVGPQQRLVRPSFVDRLRGGPAAAAEGAIAQNQAILGVE